MTPEEEIKALKQLILNLGDGVADVIEQMLRGNWVDDHGHKVSNNVAMIKLGRALSDAADHAAKQGNNYYASS